MEDLISFSWLNIAVVIFVFIGVTAFGHFAAGRAETRDSFFLGGGGLPWWAVTTSIYATVVSAISFISIPTAVFMDGGNITYIQILIGFGLGKLLIALIFVRPFYDSTGIATVYDYISVRVDRRVGSVAMILGMTMRMLTTSVYVLTTALVLSVISDMRMEICIAAIVAVSVLWAMIAGIKTVIWTDFALFIVFMGGAAFAAVWSFVAIDLPFPELVRILDEKSKLALFDFSTNPKRSYTIWTGLIAAPLISAAAAGSQSTLQRVKSCRSRSDAYKAFVFAGVCYVLPILLVVVGLSLSVFYTVNPLPDFLPDLLAVEPDRILPFFIVTEIPDGLSGLLVAAMFAAGVSTLDSNLAEVANITISNIYERYFCPDGTEQHYLRASRVALLLWGVAFGFAAMAFNNYQAGGILALTFSAFNLVAGSIFGTVILARMGVGNWPSYIAGLCVSFVAVFVLRHWGVTSWWWVPTSAAVLVAIAWPLSRRKPEWRGVCTVS